MPTPADGAIGALDWSKDERKRLAKLSQNYCCPTCGKCSQLIPVLDQEAKKKSGTRFAKEIAELQRLQLTAEKKKITGGTSTTGGNEAESCAEEKTETMAESIDQEAPEEEIVFGDRDHGDRAVQAHRKTTDEEIRMDNDEPTTIPDENSISDMDEMQAAVPMDDPSWMYDPLLNLMLILMAVICYLLIQKYQELMEELREIRQLASDPA